MLTTKVRTKSQGLDSVSTLLRTFDSDSDSESDVPRICCWILKLFSICKIIFFFFFSDEKDETKKWRGKTNHPRKGAKRGDVHGEVELRNGRVDHGITVGKEPELVEVEGREEFVALDVEICCRNEMIVISIGEWVCAIKKVKRKTNGGGTLEE